MNARELLAEWLRTLQNVKYGPVDGKVKENLIKLIEDTRHYVDSNTGLWATDRLDDILGMLCDEENQPHQFVGRQDELKKRSFFEI